MEAFFQIELDARPQAGGERMRTDIVMNTAALTMDQMKLVNGGYAVSISNMCSGQPE